MHKLFFCVDSIVYEDDDDGERICLFGDVAGSVSKWLFAAISNYCICFYAMGLYHNINYNTINY